MDVVCNCRLNEWHRATSEVSSAVNIRAIWANNYYWQSLATDYTDADDRQNYVID